MNRTSMLRADTDFKDMLNRIRDERRKIGKDNRDISDRRLTLAISRVPNLEKFVINSNIIKEKDLRNILK